MRWLEPEWRDETEAWIQDHVQVTGPIEQPHVRPWATAMRVPTTDGDVWFKAVGAGHGFEPGLTALLAESFPGRVTEVVEIDADQGWMLMRDAGIRLRELEGAGLAEWEAVLPRYAEIQIGMGPRIAELLELGVPDQRLAGLPDKVAELLDDDRALLLDEPEGLTSAQREELHARMPQLHDLVAELQVSEIPETIQHDDLHDGQVFARGGGHVIADWGDSCISHPFHTLTVTLRALAWRHGLEPGAEPLLRLRDAYLEPYRTPAPVGDLAYRTGTLARALAWHRHLQAREPEHWDRDDAESVPYGLRLFLEAGPIGTWE